MSVGKGSIARATKTTTTPAAAKPAAETKKAAPAKKPATATKKPAAPAKKPAAPKAVERPDNLKVTNKIYEVGQPLPMYLL